MGHVRMEFSEITSQITIGTNMCCDVHAAKLMEAGYYADIDLEEKREEAPPAVQYYLWLPVKDHTAPTADQLLLGAEAIVTLVKDNKKVYVHCRHGHGRSPSLVIGYFIMTGLSVDEAMAKVRLKRPEISLEPVQIQALREFEENSQVRP